MTRTIHGPLVIACAVAWLTALGAGPAAAQPSPGAPAGRIEATVGALWLGGAALGSEPAELRANRVTPTPFTLFEADTSATRAAGFDGRVSYWIRRTLAVEAGFVFARPALRTRITGDAEGASALTLEERLDQYFFDASVVWLVERLRVGGRTVPFVSGGAGYLRQLHEGRTFVETGQVYHVGGGVRHALYARPAGFVRGVGLRADARLYVLSEGVQLEDRPRAHGAVAGGLYVTF